MSLVTMGLISISMETHCALLPSLPSNEPFFLGLVDGFWVVGADDGRVRRLPGGLAAAFGFVGVVGAFVAEHVADEEHQSAEDGEDHHRDDACREGTRLEAQRFNTSPYKWICCCVLYTEQTSKGF